VGNGSGDSNVRVEIDNIAGGQKVTIGFSVKINEGISASTLLNQATLSTGGVTGAAGLVSTDPDTEQVDAPTVTALSTIPTALDIVTELAPLNSSFLPLMAR